MIPRYRRRWRASPAFVAACLLAIARVIDSPNRSGIITALGIIAAAISGGVGKEHYG